jgi:hypothetical protein
MVLSSQEALLDVDLSLMLPLKIPSLQRRATHPISRSHADQSSSASAMERLQNIARKVPAFLRALVKFWAALQVELQGQ